MNPIVAFAMYYVVESVLDGKENDDASKLHLCRHWQVSSNFLCPIQIQK